LEISSSKPLTPRIMMAREEALSWSEIEDLLGALTAALRGLIVKLQWRLCERHPPATLPLIVRRICFGARKAVPPTEWTAELDEGEQMFIVFRFNWFDACSRLLTVFGPRCPTKDPAFMVTSRPYTLGAVRPHAPSFAYFSRSNGVGRSFQSED
jgi:hypothetical protein